MCDFISIGLPAALTDKMTAWRRRQYALTEHLNPALKKALPPKYVPWLLTTGHCSCDLCCHPPKSEQPKHPKPAFFLRADAAEIIRELAGSHTGRTFLYVHTYTGDVSSDQLPIASRSRKTLDALSSANDPLLRDELVELTTKAPFRRSELEL
jgi:hypothetical protein